MIKGHALSALTIAAFFSVTAAAQTISFSFTGAGVGATASGSGTLSPGGAATFTAAVRNTNNDNCDQSLQLVIAVALPNGDLLNFLFDATSASQSGNTQTFQGNLLVLSGGKGAYANLGGTGTQTIVATEAATGVTFTTTGSVTLGGPLVTKANIFPSGIANVFSDFSALAPGAWASIFGENLANGTVSWNGDFPTALGNVTGKLDGKDLYFWFVSPTQINFQVPDGTRTGCVTLTLNSPNGTVSKMVEVDAAAPAFSMLDDKYIAAIIPTPNGTGAYGNGSYDIAGPVGRFPYKTRPVKRGESLVIYGVGFGPTNPAVPAGKPFSGGAKANLQWNFVLATGQNTGISLPLNFVGEVGAGLFQINTTVPPNAPLGDILLSGFVANVSNGPHTQSYLTLISIGQ